MVYGLKDDELVPLEEYWGRLPKYEMLTSTAVLVFDFGTEMYIWSGINANSDEKYKVLKLAKELWNEGFNYSECSVCPINIALLLGERSSSDLPKISNSRPEWALFCKITQHRETILFKEKFLDWPDFSRTVLIKDEIINIKIELFYDIKPIDMNEMLREVTLRSDIVIEGYRLVRGDSYFDEETNRIFQFDTLKVTVWRIMENSYEIVNDESIGQFYEGDSYIVKWNFTVSVKVRKLSGKPSKSDPGRNFTLFFFWIGCKSSINETGIAALLTVALNSENAPQIRVTQGCEPPPFLQLFNGMMVIHKGKMGATKKSARVSKLFILRGEIEREAHLVEVPCKAQQLRSRASFLLLNSKRNEVTIWYGCKATGQTRKVLKNCVEALLRLRLSHLNLSTKPKLKELEEGNKDRYFDEILGNTKNAYISLLEDQRTYNFTPRLFSFSSTSGTFTATEICCPHKSEYPCPYPILQDQLYSSPQPALFLVDNEYELWLWQGWWYDKEGDGMNTSDQTGSGAIRWQAERKAAMMTAKNYWIKKHGDSNKTNVKLVWAGLEPLEFQILFPHWEKREDVAEINVKEGKEPFGKKDLEEELAVFSRNIFPLSKLQERPLPEGVDPTHLEDYLSPEDFQNVLSMTKEEYLKLPSWKQTSLKKENGLF
ncbi:hypothetical protein WA026_020164 [Henosepilachna vigintioctopunctata]|uniref:HP domain-containing protein n=1 Tax=Henosepilachna vigintioctopunctata TaxID=420089 RepID=A0AAW1UB43_9CUCU